MNSNEKRVNSKNNKFLKLFSEKEDINQYWFSESTIEFIVNQIMRHTDENSKIAFVSTPSIFFSCDDSIKQRSKLFDYDDRLLKRHSNAVKFDFNDFVELVKNEEYFSAFDFVIIDPPYINEPSWTKFAEFARIICKKDKDDNSKIQAKILTCSIAENKEILKKLLDLNMQKYQPSIPHLVYQYNFFSNYEDELLDQLNAEILID
jgi:EEF1A lysine methyltransferase 1